MARKILAILMALSLVLMFAACGGKTEEATTAPEESEVTEEITDAAEETTIEESTDVETSTDVSEVTDTEESTDVSEDAETSETEESTEEAKKAPSTTAEIVDCFNNAANGAKSSSKSITVKYVKNARAGAVTGLPGGIEGVMKLLGGVDGFIDKFMGEEEDKTNTTLSGDKKKGFPVEDQTWASKLTADDVSSAKLTEKDGKYYITITTKADGKMAKVTPGQGHNPKVFSVIKPEIVTDNIPGAVAKMFSVGTVELNYPASSITAVVDANTGKMLSSIYSLNWTINIPLGEDTVVLPFNTEWSYVINW